MKIKPLKYLMVLLLLTGNLCACRKAESPPSTSASSSMPDEPSISVLAPVDPSPALPYVNPLTGEGCETDIGQSRPIAVMLNNLKKALPQLGVSQADIIYEIPAEGGITRMLGVFQSVDRVGNIGSVRSARDYYVSLAYGHDAIFLHAGGSPQAYTAIKKWRVTALDCVNGPYEGTLYWRDADRRKNAGLEHSVLTSGATILELLPTYKRVTLSHQEGYAYPMSFLPQGERASGESAYSLTIQFSTYKTGVFIYDPESGLYKVEEYGAPYVDGNTREQVAVKNVLVLRTDVSNVQGDDKGRLSVRITGTGSGQFFCDGTVQDITWSRKDNASPMTYTTADGGELNFGVGHTYVNIIGKSAQVSVK